MTAELEATVAKLVVASEKLTKEVADNTKNVEKNTRSTNRRSWIFVGVIAAVVVLIVAVALVGWRLNEGRLNQRNQGRCDTRAGFVDLANAAKASPELTLEAIRNYDSRLADAGIPRCPGISVCEDGWYSQSTGRGACSSHGCVASILIPE